ncbi:TPA: hypothetical protein PPN70_002166, partial [Serratia rubidaea]|nr:hypothetical protein [Serratia rubidaea]HDJ1463789.1 hypothetical protein [Serratia rubidaea]HDJ2773064.1 hypothetical protein [Serratia rubidaea]
DDTPRTESGAILTDGSRPVKGTPIDSLQMLETVVGCALYPSDFDIANPPGAIIRAVTEMKKRRDPKLQAWNDMLSNTPGILQCSREAIVDLVRGADENLHATPGALRTYINTHLTEFDVPARPAPAEEEMAEEPAKEDNDAQTAEYEAPRRVWLRRAVLDALDGKTNVMSEEDAEELLAAAGDFSKVYFARLLAKEIEPCDPFSELNKDDVYHITCDVLENWSDDKEQRTEFITGRVTFNLRERYGMQQENPAVERDEASNEGEKTEVAQQQKSELQSLGGGRFDVGSLFENSSLAEIDNSEIKASKAHSNEEKEAPMPHENEIQRSTTDDFQQRATQVEQVIAEQPAEAQQNLDVWKRVMRTDPRYTKPIEGAGYAGTSINSEYMFMRATEIFGPIGTGWGFDIVEEKMIAGAPMSEAVFEGGKIIGNCILRDADGTILFEQNHSLQIEFWYVLNETKGRVTAYGATPYMYKTKRGFMADSEVMKKSLTDAIKKSLSMLGFSADVFLGWHDLPEYREENATEFAIKNASDKAEDVTRLREELDEKLSAVAETISTAVTVNEASKVHGSIAREVEAHRKAAEAKGDTEHAKYLASRLRRLTVLKDERITALSEEKAQ